MAISSGNPVLKEKARVERADLRLLRVQKELQGQIRVQERSNRGINAFNEG